MSLEQHSPSRFGFIPKRLDIEGRPELNDFSRNILIVNFVVKNGQKWNATALYEPELATFTSEGGVSYMRYANIYNHKGNESTITITKNAFGWEGVKEIKESRVLEVIGSSWQQFFAHLTSAGLSNGEPCKFEPIKPTRSIVN